MNLLITSNKLSKCEIELSFKDLEEVHRIRGRILHFSSIVENTLKRVITKNIYNNQKQILKNKKGNARKFKDLDFNDRSKLFIRYLESQNKYNPNQEFKKFKDDLNILRKDYRNLWAHGFIYYKKYELDIKDNTYKPINFIKDRKIVPIHFRSQHFKLANEIFPGVISFLHKNKFLKIKKFKIIIR